MESIWRRKKEDTLLDRTLNKRYIKVSYKRAHLHNFSTKNKRKIYKGTNVFLNVPNIDSSMYMQKRGK